MRRCDPYPTLGFAAALFTAELYAPNMRVAIIFPGGIRTPFIGATGTPTEAAIAPLPFERRVVCADGLAAFARGRCRDRLGSPLERVATAILRVIERRNPAARVLVGPDAHLLHVLKRWLPEAIHSALVHALFAPRVRATRAGATGGALNVAG